MMGRKLVKHGEATLMISLPSKWVRANSLSKGDELNIEEKDNRLILSKDAKKKEKKVFEMTVSSMTESSIRAILTNLYRLGYDKITLNFMKAEVAAVIEKETKNNLIGFEIIQKDNKRCVIENITEPSEEQFNNIFSKVLLNIDGLFDMLKDSLEGKKVDYESTERQIQAFDNFCRRVISKSDNSMNQLRWNFHSEILHAQRELFFAIKMTSKIKTGKEIEGILSDGRRIYDLLKETYGKKDLSVIERIHELEKKTIYDKGYELLGKSKENNEKIVIHHILSSIRSFYLASSPLMGLIILNLL